MNFSTYRLPARGWRSGAAAAIALFTLALLAGLALGGSAGAASGPVPLGTAGSFAVLAGAGITNTGATTITGDLGTHPTPAYTGAASVTLHGTTHLADGVALGAKNDLVTAYNNAAGQGPTSPIAADLAGRTLTAGVYNSGSSIGLSGVLTLNAAGDPNAVFVFQAGSTLITGPGSSVSLINGAQPCNVYWQVGSSATLGTTTSFVGTIMAMESITLDTGATVNGRVLARNAAVTLHNNTITSSTCAAPATPPATTATTPTATTPTTTTPTPSTTTPTTTTATTPTPTATTPKPTPTATTPKPTPKPTPKAKPVTKRVAGATTTKHVVVAKTTKHVVVAKTTKHVVVSKTAKHVAAIKKTLAKPKPRPAVHTSGFTG
jgi:hypothetical protein